MTESGSFALFLVSLIAGTCFAHFAAITYSWALLYKNNGFKNIFQPMMIATAGLHSLSFLIIYCDVCWALNKIFIPHFEISLKNHEIKTASFLMAAILLILLAKIFTKRTINETEKAKNVLQ